MLYDLVATAGNVRRQSNPEYTLDDFLSVYPQFENVLNSDILEFYVELARSNVSARLFCSTWKYAVGLLAAHYCTLHLQSAVDADADADAVKAAGTTQGVVTSESADGVSYSMDSSLLSNDLQGWGAYKLTTYGVQFATIARMKGKGGMYIW